MPKREELGRTRFRPGIENKIPSTRVSSLSLKSSEPDDLTRARTQTTESYFSLTYLCVPMHTALLFSPTEKTKNPTE